MAWVVAWQGKTRQGPARQGKAWIVERQGMARQGKARHGMDRGKNEKRLQEI